MKQKKESLIGTPYKKLASTYFSTNKCSIIGDVRLLPGSDTCLPTHSSLISYNSSIYIYYHSSFFCRHLNSFFFELILPSCLQLLSLFLSLPTLELFRFDYLQLSHLPSSLLRLRFLVGLHSNNHSGFWALFSQKTNSPLL